MQLIRQQLLPLQRSELRPSERMSAHTTHKMFAKNTWKSYVVANSAVITGAQPCPPYEPTTRNAPRGASPASTTTCAPPTCKEQNGKSCRASTLTSIIRWSSYAEPSPRKSNETSAHRNGLRRIFHRIRPLWRTVSRTDAAGKILVGSEPLYLTYDWQVLMEIYKTWDIGYVCPTNWIDVPNWLDKRVQNHWFGKNHLVIWIDRR